MATQSPFPFLDSFFERLRSGLQPPPWMVEEIQRRLVLLFNHVLMQEPEAQARLARQAGRVVEAASDEPVTWSAGDMLAALSPPVREYLASPEYARAVAAARDAHHFRVAESA